MRDGRVHRLHPSLHPRPPRAAARGDPDAHCCRDGDRTAPRLPARAEQRPAPPSRRGPGARDARRHQRRPARRRDRGRLERARVQGDRPAVRPARRAHRSDDRGDRDPPRAVRRRAVQLLGSPLHDHRTRRPAEARPAAAPAVHRGRDARTGPSTRRPGGRHRRARPAPGPRVPPRRVAGTDGHAGRTGCGTRPGRASASST